MEHYLLIARSITQAQRMERVLQSSGYRCRYFRAPTVLSESGCSYAVAVYSESLSEIELILNSAHLQPLQVYRRSGEEWEAARS